MKDLAEREMLFSADRREDKIWSYTTLSVLDMAGDTLWQCL